MDVRWLPSRGWVHFGVTFAAYRHYLENSPRPRVMRKYRGYTIDGKSFSREPNCTSTFHDFSSFWNLNVSLIPRLSMLWRLTIGQHYFWLCHQIVLVRIVSRPTPAMVA
jgi:hypothetical protein